MAREAVTGGNRRSPLAGEARETSGITSVLLLAYLDRAGGQGAVDEVLERCGLADAETELRDENCWFSWETKIRLFEATADVLAKPDFLEEMAALSLDLNVGSGLRAALRTLGSPQLVYRSVVRANARFNGSHAMELVSIGRRQAITRFHDIAGQGRYHPLDCQYSAAMLRIVPALFALPPAQLRHRECVGDGDEACVYELEWREYAGIGRRAIAAGGTTALALGASLMAAPSALPAALGVGVASTGLLALSELRRHRQSWQALQREASDHAEVAQRLFATLQDLTSDLRRDEVLTKVTRNAQAAVGGREFALLVRDGETLACQSSSGLPAGTVTALEAWAARSPRVADQSVVLDDVSEVEVLRPLTASAMPLCSLASAPLTIFGESFGVLIALGTQSRTFLPRDVEILQSLASQASIALHNARRYHQTKTEAELDALTGLANHRSFHEAVERALGGGGNGAVVLIDLDNFKRVNDEDGHGAGDRVLREAAQALAASCRGQDQAFRVGGDEFALLLHGVSEDQATPVAARLCAAIGSLDERLGASAGVAALDPALGKQGLLEEADRRLYAAKRAERHGASRAAASSTGAARVALSALVAALELHHPPAAEHSRRVAELSELVAERLGVSGAERELSRQTALAHDLGKLVVSPQLLGKPQPLDAAEWALMRTHPERGAELLLLLPGLEAVAATVRATHERWDGGGYPAGLVAEQVPLAARIVSVCAAYDAIVSGRPYRAARTPAQAGAELRRCAGSQFDPAVVDALLGALTELPAAA